MHCFKVFRSFVFCCCLLLVFSRATAQQSAYPPYDPDVPEMADIQLTIDDAMDDIEDSLKLSGSFKPFAVVILDNDSIAEIHAGKDQKDNFTMEDLEDALTVDALRGHYKVVTIFYMSKSTNDLLEPGTTIVAIHAEHTDDDFAYHFEFPYSKPTPKTVLFTEPLVNFEEQIMYKP